MLEIFNSSISSKVYSLVRESEFRNIESVYFSADKVESVLFSVFNEFIDDIKGLLYEEAFTYHFTEAQVIALQKTDIDILCDILQEVFNNFLDSQADLLESLGDSSLKEINNFIDNYTVNNDFYGEIAELFNTYFTETDTAGTVLSFI